MGKSTTSYDLSLKFPEQQRRTTRIEVVSKLLVNFGMVTTLLPVPEESCREFPIRNVIRVIISTGRESGAANSSQQSAAHVAVDHLMPYKRPTLSCKFSKLL